MLFSRCCIRNFFFARFPRLIQWENRLQCCYFRRTKSRYSVVVKCRCHSVFSDNIALCAFDLFSWLQMLKINRYASKPLVERWQRKNLKFIGKSLSLFCCQICHFSFHNQMISKLRICKSYRQWQSNIHCVEFCETLDCFPSHRISQFSIWTRVRSHSWFGQILLLFYAPKIFKFDCVGRAIIFFF